VLRKKFCLSLLIFAALAAPGCGRSDVPELGDVYGQVTLDGKPVARLNILFSPEKGRAAGGVTDEEGRYELRYLEGYSGSKTGPAKVTFEWEPGVEATANIPAKYMKDGFDVEVKPGSNELNFPMTSN
jgi:hypothetical protein